ncbi:hypothetical protein ABN197_16955 [Providencia alcalifaciens]|uniref:hypothetical protein n=1 Tax=Providencia alcalifaciens TaxID=126385 RepID=UPI0032DB8D93
MSEYLIKRAEQYHPVIPIGAGVEVTVVFQEGFQLKFIEEMNKAKKGNSESPTLKESVNNGISVYKQSLERISLGDAVPTGTSPQ